MWAVVMRLARTVLVGSSCIAVTVICLVWMLSTTGQLVVQWSANSCLHELVVGHSTVVAIRYEEFQLTTPLHLHQGGYESRKQFEGFQKLPWYHGDNSWWERVGYTVRARWRFIGIETARGTYWPPFALQHPIVPFQLLQIPLWLCLLVAASPTVYQVIRWRKLLLGGFRPLQPRTTPDRETPEDAGCQTGKPGLPSRPAEE